MKVTVLNKKTLTIIGLVAMLIVAAIINVAMKGKKVNQSGSGSITDPESQGIENEEVETASSISSSLALEKYELERKSRIEEEIQYLDELINNESTDKETLKTATEQKMLLMNNLNTEQTIAELLVAKGFAGVTVVCGSETVNIIVADSSLDDSKVAQILDVTTRETSILPENIKIIPLD